MNKFLVLLSVFAVTFACKTPEARKPETVKTGSYIAESVVRNKKLYEAEEKAIETYIKTHDTKQFKASEYGFWVAKDSIVVEATNSKFPKFSDVVNFDFNISALDGQIIYTASELKNKNYSMDQEELFTGLREGLKLMKAGETYTFIFPSQKAYGYYGDENRIGRNTPIISTVTINSIITKK
ncbi:gliding motility-associated peptidyl-prolyl isomerase GldI [Lacinutrix jangbogonensis]|uniref:gliding motility-associated peptidyl-prolyl isomerase GldI n=1 Tax=Lacinutrix jangbogonensis TaxID=1469557 RepID=UPI00053F0779|nr:gliding motility-associated peptidyl-prolyl isomerase GldI [Lacinutrix jangbogonensis]